MMTNLPSTPANAVSPWRRDPELVQNGSGPLFAVLCSRSKIFRMNIALFSLWLMFPLFLVLTSDWIGLLVTFQAMTMALRLRKAPAAKAFVAPSSASRGRVKGDHRVL